MAITPLNPLVRTMLTSLHGAMSRGMPVDQAMSYVKSMAQQGIAPLIDLSAMLRQYEQLKQPETPMPQGGTVRDQIAQLSQMKGQGLGGFQMQPTQAAPQMGPPTTQPQAAPPMQQGLGGLDAGRMENPQGFAGGGIVAFDEGGPAKTPPIVAANLPKPRSDQEIFDFYGARVGTDYVPTFKKYETEEEGIEKESGTGEFAKSLEEKANLLKTQEKRSLEELEADRANLRRQEAADIAGYATKSRSTLEAMAKARSAAVTRERELEKEIRAARNEREKAAIALTESKETAREKRDARTVARVEKDTDRFLTAEKTLNDRLARKEELAAEVQMRKALAGFEAASRMAVARYDRDTQLLINEAKARVEAGKGISTDYYLGGAFARVGALTESIAREADPAKKAAMQQELARANAEVDNIVKRLNETKVRTGASPIDVTQARPAAAAPAAGGNVRSQADAILAGG